MSAFRTISFPNFLTSTVAYLKNLNHNRLKQSIAIMSFFAKMTKEFDNLIGDKKDEKKEKNDKPVEQAHGEPQRGIHPKDQSFAMSFTMSLS